MLDERFRRRVGEVAAAADSAGLGEAAYERIVSRVVAEGPRVIRRARISRVALFAAGPLLAAAAAVAVWLHPVRHATSPTALAPAAQAGAALACASRSVPAGAERGFVTDASGAERLDLGHVAVATATSGAVVHLTEATACRTLIVLDSGTVTVHAKDLGGGELRVHAPGGEVTVHGTLFAVTQDSGSFLVEVAQGRVGVVDTAGTHTVSTGGRLLVSPLGVAEGKLSAPRAREMRASVGTPDIVGLDTLKRARPDPESGEAPKGESVRSANPVNGGHSVVQAAPEASAPLAPDVVDLQETAAVPAPSAKVAAPADPLTLAEAARRSGEFQRARELYRRAGERTGVTAEAAWVALARMELSLGHTSAALEATKRRQEQFGQGTLGPEALWIDVRAYRQTGDMTRARTLANNLVQRWPASPQAHAAGQWLSGE